MMSFRAYGKTAMRNLKRLRAEQSLITCLACLAFLVMIA